MMVGDSKPARSHSLLPELFSFQADRRRRKNIEVELIGHVLDNFLCFDAVSLFVEWWRKDGDSPFARHDGEDTSAYATFGG